MATQINSVRYIIPKMRFSGEDALLVMTLNIMSSTQTLMHIRQSAF